MSHQQPNAWQTARPRHSHSASRMPPDRSGTASPSQQAQPTQPPRHDGGRPAQVNNVWTSRSSSAGGSNGPSRGAEATAATSEDQHTPVHGFNAADVKTLLSGEVASQLYKPVEVSGAGRAGTGGAWGSKSNHMANNQPFFVQLAKQVATMEGGG